MTQDFREVTCPKCGRKGQFGYFGEADAKGVIAQFRHAIGHEQVHDFFGGTRSEVKYERCFITQAELEAQPWYRDWLAYKEARGELPPIEMGGLLAEKIINSPLTGPWSCQYTSWSRSSRIRTVKL